MAVDVLGVGKRMGRTVAESVVDNAVVTKEFRTRMRGWKPFAIMGGYVLLLVVVLAIAFSIVAAFSSSGPYQYQSLGDRKVGLELFGVLTVAQVILLTLVLPSLTASSLTHESERKTIDMLALSRLTSGKIVIGKHLAGFLYALMLLACSIPLAGLCMMLGGISPAEVGVTYIAMATWAFMFTSAGVMWSTLFRKTAAATLCSYGTCVAYMLFSSTVGAWGMFAYGYGSGIRDVFAFSVANPAYAPYTGLYTADICGMHISVTLLTGIVQVAIGVLAIMIASSHVPYRGAERPLSIRLTLLAISAVVFFIMAGDRWLVGALSSPSDFKGWLTVLSISLMIALGLGAAAFACGEIRKVKPGMSIGYGFSLRRIFTNDLGGSSLFMMLWVIVAYGAIGLGLRINPAMWKTALGADLWAAYWKIGIAMLAIILGLSALGIMFSSFVPRRRNAMGLTVIVLIALFLVYSIMLIGYTGSSDRSPVWQLAVLWPVTPVMTAVGEWKNSALPKLGYEDDAWLACTATYLIIAAIALTCAGHFHSKGMGVREEDS